MLGRYDDGIHGIYIERFSVRKCLRCMQYFQHWSNTAKTIINSVCDACNVSNIGQTVYTAQTIDIFSSFPHMYPKEELVTLGRRNVSSRG